MTDNDKPLGDATRAVTAGRRPESQDGVVNPAVYHASTILAPTLQAFRGMRTRRPGDAVTYGVHGTRGTFAFEEALTELEGGYRTRLAPTGLLAITGSLLAFTSAGDHLLMCDNCYEPTRAFCRGPLRRLGVETEYYDPKIGGDIRRLFRPNTRAVMLESPGSLSFELQDTPAITAAAKEIDAWTLFDNTWASPIYFQPLAHGVDVSIQAITKYVAGHADLVMGAVTTTERAYETLQPTWRSLGISVGPDDVYLAMRGLRTLPVRMKQHWSAGLKVAEWLKTQPEVVFVRHPALPDDPDHALWARDFSGAGSLFGFMLEPRFKDDRLLGALLDELRFFGMGYSWGGYLSLLTPNAPQTVRTATPWPPEGRPDGQMMRIFIGLEDPEDLIRDLEAGFARMRAAAA